MRNAYELLQDLQPSLLPFIGQQGITHIQDRLRSCELFLGKFNPFEQFVWFAKNSADDLVSSILRHLVLGLESVQIMDQARDFPKHLAQRCKEFEPSSFEDFVLRHLTHSYFNLHQKHYRESFGIISYQRAYLVDYEEPLSLAQEIVQGNGYDLAVVIGPEGFGGATLFELLGFPRLHVSVDEYCKTEDRPYKELEDLKGIQGKRVLLVEDDVQTGRTLQKVLIHLHGYKPHSIGLYLSLPADRQVLSNVPAEILQTHTVPRLAHEQLQQERKKMFELLCKRYPIMREGPF